jgi:GT2 family glycosyltransferase
MQTSVVIPTFNAGPGIGALLESLRAQKPAPPDEIIAIDSGSKDDTCRRVTDAGGRIIPWQEPFDHGLTRDAGVAATKGEVVILTVQDAVPVSEQWLARMLSHFNDPTVAGVSGMQIPPADGPLELMIKARLDAEQASGPVKVSLAAHPDYARYTPAQRLELYRFDDVCSALRRSAWEKIHFGACRYAEDMQWARRAIEAGFTVVRDPAAAVIHAHRRKFWYEFRRALLDAWVMDETFGYVYRTRDKLNRASELRRAGSNGQPLPFSAKLSAAKTYSAHVFGRTFYSGYRTLGRPLGIGKGIMNRLTRGI